MTNFELIEIDWMKCSNLYCTTHIVDDPSEQIIQEVTVARSYKK